MKYGLYLPNFGPYGRPQALVDLARDAEQSGWDGFFIWDHVNRGPAVFEVVDPWIVLSAIAVVTRTIKIGALVTPLPRRRPWKVARETVSLDHLSGGRLIFGAGAGSTRSSAEWGNLGESTDLKVRGAMLDEGLAILAGLWSGQPFSCDGDYYHVQDSQFVPTPLQSPRIPVWIASYWPNKPPLRRAARWDGMFPLFDPETEGPQKAAMLKAAVDYVQQYRADLSGFEVICRGHTDHMPGDGTLMESYAEVGATWWLEHLVPTNFGGTWDQPWPVEAIRRRILQGPPGR